MILCSFRDLLSSCPGGKEYRELLTINRKERRDEKKKREEKSEKNQSDSVLSSCPGECDDMRKILSAS